MLHVFRLVVAKQCERFDCPANRNRVGVHEVFCSRCEHALAPVTETNRPLVYRVTALGLAVLAGSGFLVYSMATHRAARQEVELLERAGDLFQKSLTGAKAADVEARADGIQLKLRLTPEQRRRMMEEASDVISRLPQSLSPELKRRMETLLRDAYRDGMLSLEDNERLDVFVREQRIPLEDARSFEKGVASRIESAQRSLGRGNALIRQRQYAEAHAEFLRATETDPEDPLLWASLGASHMLLGRAEEAAVCYDRALRIDERHWLAHYNRGLLAARKGDQEGAFHHFEQALTWVPPSADRERRAMIQDLLEEPSLAALRGDPRFAEILSRGTSAKEPAPWREAS